MAGLVDFKGKHIRLIYDDGKHGITKTGILEDIDSDCIIFFNDKLHQIEIIPLNRIIRIELRLRGDSDGQK